MSTIHLVIRSERHEFAGAVWSSPRSIRR